jgi:hypothetical protein
MVLLPSDPLAPDWSRFVNTLVNVPRRFAIERPALQGISRQGVLAHILFVVASGRPRLSVPVAAVPEFRRGVLAELLESGEILKCTSERGSAHVAPVILLDAVRQLPQCWRERLLDGDPVAAVWREWTRSAPTPRPLTEIASDVLAHASDAGHLPLTADRLRSVAETYGLTAIGALVRGTIGVRAPAPPAGVRASAEQVAVPSGGEHRGR